jgi:tellurite resistance protein TehA-like permease
MSFGVALQGMGFFLSLLYQASILSRLHNDGFPLPRERPSLFMASLPPALTAWASVALAQQALRHFPTPATAPGGDPGLIVGGVALYYVGVTFGLMFWGLALWWFLIAALGCLGGITAMRSGVECLAGFMVVFAHGKSSVKFSQIGSADGWL